ncbi:MAG: MFS transporter [Chloroflexota bacterium]
MTTLTSETPVGYIELLRSNKDFRWLWGGQVVSLLGDWFNLIASAALLAQLTDSGLAIGGLFVIRMLAPFFAAPFAGVIADRFNRKRILIVTDVIRFVAVLGFLFIQRPEQVWLLYVLTGIQLGTGGFFFPTKNAILPDIVKPNEIGTANTISSVTWSTMLAIGAALGGLVAGFWGIRPAFIIDALTFIVSALFILQVRYTPETTTTAPSTTVSPLHQALQQYMEGINYLRERKDQLVIATLKGTNAMIISSGFQIVQVKLSESVFVLGEGGGISLGLFFGVAGIGTGLGPVVARWITGDNDRPMRWGIAVAWLISGTGMWIVSTLASFPIALLGTLFRGIGGGIVWVFSTQLLLQLVPGEVRGRIFATEYMIFTLLSAIGAAVIGWVLDSPLDISIIMRVMGSLTLIPAVLWALWIASSNLAQKEI